MTNAPIRILVLLAAIILICSISLQVIWSLRASDSLDQQFSHNVKMSLNNAVESVCQVNGTDIPLQNPVEQVSNAYFIVRTNQPIQLQSLKSILTTEFENRSIQEDFEFGVYDCKGDRMIYGDFVSMKSTNSANTPTLLPILEDYDYYFGVYFPDHAKSFWWGQPLLQWTTIITVLMSLFFGYAIFILLRQKRLGAIQRDFMNNIMHELKTPVSSLKIASEVLTGGDIIDHPRRLGKYSELIHKETSKLEAHVMQLLGTAELDQKKALKLEKVLLNQLLMEIQENMSSKLEGKQLEIKCDEKSYINADRYYLEIILINLIDNAIKYGGEVISLNSYRKAGFVIIEVFDNGKGIPEKEANKVFQRFYRIPNGDIHDEKGFGLGLYVVRNLVKKLKGKVKLIDPSTAKFSMKFKSA